MSILLWEGQVRDVLTQVGLIIEWKEYTSANQEGHWFKNLEELDNIAKFSDRGS